MTTTTNMSSGTSSLNSALYGTSSSSASTSGISAQQDKFLTLLVAQMKNKDPMNPMDNAQVTTQIAQISTVQGIEKLNQSVESLSTMMTGMQATQAANLIGRNVLAQGNNLQLSSGMASGGVELANDATLVKVAIKDANGNLVRELNLGEQAAGVVNFAWDGTDGNTPATQLSDGKYTFSVSAYNISGDAVDATPLGYARVDNVSINKNNIQVSVNGKDLDLNSIYEIQN